MKLFGYGSDLGMLFIVSEYFPNGSLKRHIRKGKEVDKFLFYFICVALTWDKNT